MNITQLALAPSNQTVLTLVEQDATDLVLVNSSQTSLTLSDSPTVIEFSNSLTNLSVQQITNTTTLQTVADGITEITSAVVGPVGPAGATSTLRYQGLAAQNMPVGTPVYISPFNRQLYPADHSLPTTSKVVGLLLEASTAGFMVDYDRASLTITDWSAITGSVTLLAGQVYFLALNGTLTTSVPTTGTNTRVGEALDTQTLGIMPSIVPILL